MENTNMTKSPFNNVHALVFFIQKRISYTKNEMIAISKIFRREIRGSNVSQDEAFIISSVKISTCYHSPFGHIYFYTYLCSFTFVLRFLVLIRCTFTSVLLTVILGTAFT